MPSPSSRSPSQAHSSSTSSHAFGASGIPLLGLATGHQIICIVESENLDIAASKRDVTKTVSAFEGSELLAVIVSLTPTDASMTVILCIKSAVISCVWRR